MEDDDEAVAISTEDLHTEDPIVRRARNLSSVDSYSLMQLSVGTDARQGF